MDRRWCRAISRGAALCASGLSPCGASWAGTVVPDRQRRAAATPRGYRVERGQPVSHVSHQHHHLGGLAPLCHHRRGTPVRVKCRRASRAVVGRSPVGSAWAGPCATTRHTTINRPATHWATDPPTRHAAPAAAGGRRPLADDSEAAGPAGLGRAGRSSPARSGGPEMVITALAPRHHSGCARGILRPLGQITPGPPGNPLNPAPGVITQLWTFSQPPTCCVICP